MEEYKERFVTTDVCIRKDDDKVGACTIFD